MPVEIKAPVATADAFSNQVDKENTILKDSIDKLDFPATYSDLEPVEKRELLLEVLDNVDSIADHEADFKDSILNKKEGRSLAKTFTTAVEFLRENQAELESDNGWDIPSKEMLRTSGFNRQEARAIRMFIKNANARSSEDKVSPLELARDTLARLKKALDSSKEIISKQNKVSQFTKSNIAKTLVEEPEVREVFKNLQDRLSETEQKELVYRLHHNSRVFDEKIGGVFMVGALLGTAPALLAVPATSEFLMGLAPYAAASMLLVATGLSSVGLSKAAGWLGGKIRQGISKSHKRVIEAFDAANKVCEEFVGPDQVNAISSKVADRYFFNGEVMLGQSDWSPMKEKLGLT